jgi:hypothetical protein
VSVNRLGELLDVAAEVPQRYRTPALAGIQRRVRRRRATIAATASAVLVVVVLGGFGIARAVAVGPVTHPPAGPGASPTPSPIASAASLAPVPADATALPWSAAMVSRDEQTITVHSGAGDLRGCKRLDSPRAEVTVQDAGQVVIAVRARVVAAADCTDATNDSVNLTVTLPATLGTRAVRDAATGAAGTVFRERDLPQLPVGWSPVPQVSWGSGSAYWFDGYNGPNGTGIRLSATPGNTVGSATDSAHKVRLGTRQGVISGGDGGLWAVAWQADGSTYKLDFEPVEGGSMSLYEFTQLLGRMTWS